RNESSPRAKSSVLAPRPLVTVSRSAPSAPSGSSSNRLRRPQEFTVLRVHSLGRSVESAFALSDRYTGRIPTRLTPIGAEQAARPIRMPTQTRVVGLRGLCMPAAPAGDRPASADGVAATFHAGGEGAVVRAARRFHVRSWHFSAAPSCHFAP